MYRLDFFFFQSSSFSYENSEILVLVVLFSTYVPMLRYQNIDIHIGTMIWDTQ